MRRFPGFALMLLILSCVPSPAGQATEDKLSNQDVKDLVAIGLSVEAIVDKIHTAEVTAFDTSVEALKSLKAANVPDEVIRAIINAHPNAAAAPAGTSASSASSSASGGAKGADSNSAVDYQHSLKMAEGYMQERRWEDALAAFHTAYESNPQPWLLARMGIAYLASGMGTDAEDVFDKVLAQGGDVQIFVRHQHGWEAPCFGHLVIGREHLTWLSNQVKKENFQVNWSDVQKVENFESSFSADNRQQNGQGAP